MNDDMIDAACCPPSTVPGALPDTATSDREVAQVAKALAHPARVRILRLLIASPSCSCGEIVEALPLAQATVSQHLKVLKEAGLIKGEIDGPRVCYCADRELIDHFGQMVEMLSQAPFFDPEFDQEMEVVT